ncbi:16S rRNA (cytidine(1402)-2'-O)-methyltransferase [Algoriphagus sp. AGSA1]|uniref:16S rRNA (cytidine(1402)-2'-O)-methyltransferase n=1 Tax=Algoriphagus sp. AGSA1 TaxID=2907213 RepID=UPI001F158926|nr:16S rRNA (cytidine(1402)-2'-O)-methyltransferase [Algoriphagus sp. AGSA1]MCE7056361.1 16S rRNA (cytidine(1402)-2'-O)-methyltransferase [Algoriphagus sp. AGSA1]
MSGTSPNLFLVPTPIGNLKDITLRAIEVLKTADVILAEDTRTSGQLLKHLEISRPLQSYHIFNEHKTVEKLVERMNGGEVFALISDAGTPAISDPGFLLVREVLAAGLEVQCLPGATAFVPALVNSGLPNDRFVFEGFLPHKKGRKTRIEGLVEEVRTIILYESPHRLLKTLGQLAEAFGADRLACVSRELTKLHEENVRGTLAELIDYYQTNTLKGEIVLTVAGKNPKA